MKTRRLFAGLCIVVAMAATIPPSIAGQTPTVADLVSEGHHDFQTGNYAAAESHYKAALDLMNASTGPPSDRAKILGSLAHVLLSQTRFQEAEVHFKAAMKIVAGEPVDGQVKAILMIGISTLYLETQRVGLAEPLLRDALRLSQSVFGKRSHEAAHVFRNLGIAHALKGDFKAAEKMFNEALAIHEDLPGIDPGDTAAVLSSLASVFSASGNWRKAEPLFVRAVELMEVASGPNHPDVAAPLVNLAEYYSSHGNHAAAEAALRRALSIRKQAFGPDTVAVALTSARLAVILTEQGKYDEARNLFASSLSTQEGLQAGASPAYARTLEQFAALHRKVDGRSEAEMLEARAKYVRATLSYTVPVERLGK